MSVIFLIALLGLREVFLQARDIFLGLAWHSAFGIVLNSISTIPIGLAMVLRHMSGPDLTFK
ncbi:MAG TPA: hypothetical protein VJW77_10025 [Terriglobia bacterium]|nr:hypothetical protein [Terriglobia bacterium]